MTDWKVKKHRNVCALTGKEFAPGDALFSVIVEDKKFFVRKDISESAFTDELRAQAFSYWRSVIPLPDNDEPKHKLIDAATLLAFFARLVDSTNVEHTGFRYLLALLLLRKKILTLKDIEFEGKTERLILVQRKTKTEYRIDDPGLSETEIAELKKRISTLFESPELFEETAAEPAAPPSEPSGESSAEPAGESSDLLENFPDNVEIIDCESMDNDSNGD